MNIPIILRFLLLIDLSPHGGDGCQEEEEVSDNDAELEAPYNSKNKENVKSKTEEAKTTPLRGMFLMLLLFFLATSLAT